MVKAFLGKKLNMSQIFDTHGRSVPVTIVAASVNVVTAIKDKETDGYKAVQLGTRFSKKVGRNVATQLKKAATKEKEYPTFIKEVAFDNDVKVGQKIKINEVFAKGSMVDVVGVSKGKGFAGVVKRHGFKGGPKTHGQSDRHRAPGSIGATTTPGRVFKGLRMAGHMGVDQVTIRGLEVVGVDEKEEKLLIKGAIPGPSGSFVLIKKSNIKRKKYVEPVIQNINLGGDDEEKPEGEETTESSNDTTVENTPEHVDVQPEAAADAEGGENNG